MKKNLLLTATLLLAGSLFASDNPKEDVTAAAKALGEKSYSWTTTVEMGGNSNFRPGPTEGKISKDGTVMLTYTMQDNTMTAFLKDGKGAIKTEEGWQSLADMNQGQQGRGRFMGRMLRNYKAPSADVSDIIGKVKGLKDEGGVLAGEMTEEGAKSLLAFRRGGNANGGGNNEGPTVSGAKGSVKFWLKSGNLAKFEYHVEGTVSFNGNDRDVDRTTTVEIKEVDSTSFSVPDEAKSKLAAQ